MTSIVVSSPNVSGKLSKGDADVSDNYRYRVVSRIRTKIENVDGDIEIFSQNREDLLKELREVVCEDDKVNHLNCMPAHHHQLDQILYWCLQPPPFRTRSSPFRGNRTSNCEWGS